MTHTEFGPKVLKRIMDHIKDEAVQDGAGRMEGKRFVTVLRAAKNQPKRIEELQNIKKEEKDEKIKTEDKKSSSQEV